MTKKITQYLFITGCFLVVLSFSAYAGVVGSKHDFSRATGYGVSPFAGLYRMYLTSTGTDKGYVNEVCVFCHTPHNASKSQYYGDGTAGSVPGYLWNRVTPVGAGANNNNYTLYGSPTLSVITVAAPTGISLMCLSCHDGVTSIAVGSVNAINNILLELPLTGPVNVKASPASANTQIGLVYNGDQLTGGWGANIGNIDPIANPNAPIDLSNDHPVSFKTAGLTIPGMVSSWPTNPLLRLFGSNKNMECSTCHNVHDNTTYPPFLAMSNDRSAMCLACHDK